MVRNPDTTNKGSILLIWVGVCGLFLGTVALPLSLLFPNKPTWGLVLTLFGLVVAIGALLTRWLTWATLAPVNDQPPKDKS
jgi:hypothetical protein